MHFKKLIPVSLVSAFAASALVIAPPAADALPPSKDAGRFLKDDRPNAFFPVAREMTKIFSVRQMIEIRGVMLQYQPVAQPQIDELIEANRQLTKAVMSDSVDEDAIRAGAARVADARADLAITHAKIYQEIKSVARPDQIDRLGDLRELAFDRIRSHVDLAARLVALK